MKINLLPKADLGDLAHLYKRQSIVCQHLEADDTLLVYTSPFHMMSVLMALRVDLDGRGTLGEEAAHVFLEMIRILRLPLLK